MGLLGQIYNRFKPKIHLYMFKLAQVPEQTRHKVINPFLINSTRLLGRFAPILYLNCEHVLLFTF